MPQNKEIEDPIAGVIPIYYEGDVYIKGYKVLWHVLVPGDLQEDYDRAINLMKQINAVIKEELDGLLRDGSNDPSNEESQESDLQERSKSG